MRPPRQTDLFGPAPKGERDRTPVQLRMTKIDETDLGVFLALDGQKGTARWAPRSEVTAGVGRDANLYSMARWVARERGWL